MITQELVGFIKQQLQEGKSKEQIANILTPHGWELADINAVFAQLLPTAAPVVPPQVTVPSQSVMQQPHQSFAPATSQQFLQQAPAQSSAQSSAQPAGAQQPVGFIGSFKNPSAVVTGITIVLSSIISTLVMYYVIMSSAASSMMPQSQFPTTIDQNSMIAGILASTLVTIILSGLITKLVTKILSIEPRTFAQAFTFSATALVISSALYLTTAIGVPIAAPAIGGIIIWVLWFWYYYGTGIGKAIGAFFLNLLAGMIIAGAIIAGAFAFGVGMIATLIGGFSGVANFADVQMTDQRMAPVDDVIRSSVPVQSLDAAIDSGMSPDSPDGVSLTPEELSGIISASQSAISLTSSATSSVLGVEADTLAKTNPDYTHVKDALPVGFPLPKEEERIITAAVLSANTYEGVRYILEYTSTNSLAYLRNSMKTALEKAGYTYSINEKDLNHRVITATQVVRGNVRSFRIELKQVGAADATVKVVFSQ